MRTILIIDDEPRTRDGIKKVLELWGSGQYKIETAVNGAAALEWLKNNQAQLVISDIRMPGMTGLELVAHLSEREVKPTVILVSGYSEFAYAQQAIRFGVVDYLLKPIDKNNLIKAIENAIVRIEEQQQINTMREVVDNKLLAVAEQQKYNPQIEQALTYIHEHLKEPLSLKGLSELLHLNASYFSVLFKEQVGLTFSEYLTRSRVQLAKELLLTTNLTISDIAEQVGYQTDKYFVKVFRSISNTSPAQYRKNNKGNNDITIQ